MLTSTGVLLLVFSSFVKLFHPNFSEGFTLTKIFLLSFSSYQLLHDLISGNSFYHWNLQSQSCVYKICKGSLVCLCCLFLEQLHIISSAESTPERGIPQIETKMETCGTFSFSSLLIFALFVGFTVGFREFPDLGM